MTREEVAAGMAQWYRYMFKEALKRSGGDLERAEDIRSYAVAMGLSRPQSARRETFTTWLMFLIKGATVRLNEANASRARKHGELELWLSSGANDNEATDRAAERASVSRVVSTYVSALPGRYREAVVCAYYDEAPVGRRRGHLYRAKAMLRERLERNAPELAA